ncbi:MAG: molybdopterin cofactor-binding domain-containing protein, partial [Woeseiaceae bacterium]
MGKWTRRAFVTAGVLAGGVLAIGIAIRPGSRAGKAWSLVADAGETLFGIWLKLAPDNSVTAIVPHAEMGQGVHTTLAMMLADEMDADWSRIRIMEAPAHREYANYALARGYALGESEFPAWLLPTVDGFFLQATRFMSLQITGGSTSTRTTGQLAMRVAGAAARAVLLEAASQAWEVDPAELLARDGVIYHEDSGRSAAFAEFALRAAALDAPVTPRLKSPDEYRIMGTSVARLDVPAKVDGSARFGIDAVLPGMKYAAVRAAPVFGSVVEGFDPQSIQHMPGVRKIVDLHDAVGVIADGYWQASRALDRLEIRFRATGNDRLQQSDIYVQF